MVIEYSEEPIHKKHKFKLIIFGIFLIILFFLIYTSFSGNFPLTGNLIKNEIDLNNSISISADLTIPNLSLNDEYKHIEFIGGSDSFFYIGNEKFPLKGSRDNYIILTDYDGKISFDKKSIIELKGKVTEVSINGVSVMPELTNTVKVYINDDFNYDSLEIKDDVFIKKLDYQTSGIVKLDEKTTINLNNDDIIIGNFYGSLKIENNIFKIQGYVERFNVKGEQEISISG